MLGVILELPYSVPVTPSEKHPGVEGLAGDLVGAPGFHLEALFRREDVVVAHHCGEHELEVAAEHHVFIEVFLFLGEQVGEV